MRCRKARCAVLFLAGCAGGLAEPRSGTDEGPLAVFWSPGRDMAMLSGCRGLDAGRLSIVIESVRIEVGRDVGGVAVALDAGGLRIDVDAMLRDGDLVVALDRSWSPGDEAAGSLVGHAVGSLDWCDACAAPASIAFAPADDGLAEAARVPIGPLACGMGADLAADGDDTGGAPEWGAPEPADGADPEDPPGAGDPGEAEEGEAEEGEAEEGEAEEGETEEGWGEPSGTDDPCGCPSGCYCLTPGSCWESGVCVVSADCSFLSGMDSGGGVADEWFCQESRGTCIPAGYGIPWPPAE